MVAETSIIYQMIFMIIVSISIAAFVVNFYVINNRLKDGRGIGVEGALTGAAIVTIPVSVFMIASSHAQVVSSAIPLAISGCIMLCIATALLCKEAKKLKCTARYPMF